MPTDTLTQICMRVLAAIVEDRDSIIAAIERDKNSLMELLSQISLPEEALKNFNKVDVIDSNLTKSE